MSQDENKDMRRGIALYRENPFILNIRSRLKRVTNKRGDMMLISAETGEITAPIAGFWEAEEVDSTKFLKLFVNGVKALAELSSAGAKVFELLYIEMQNNIGTDQVYLSYVGLNEIQQVSISRATFKRGISELIDKRFIASQLAPAWYWVNPDFIWNGDRLAFVKEYTRSSEKKAMKIAKEHLGKSKEIQPSLFDNLNVQDLDASPFAGSSQTPEGSS